MTNCGISSALRAVGPRLERKTRHREYHSNDHDEGDLDGNSNEEGGCGGRKRPGKSVLTPQTHPTRQFACPYYKHDPKNCNDECKRWEISIYTKSSKTTSSARQRVGN
jgi:hypothetical protein